jgi:hypothetical protein
LNIENSRESANHYLDTDDEIFAQRRPDQKFFSTPKNNSNSPKKSITVSYKTSLNQLKQIYKSISQSKSG